MQPRFSSVALACAAVLSVMSMQVQADPQSNSKMPSLTNEASLASGMTASAVRTYATIQSVLTDGKKPESATVGTSSNGANGNNTGTSNNGTNTGTSNNGTNNNGTNNNGTNNNGISNNGNNPSAFNSGSSGSSTVVGTTKPYSGNPYVSGSGSGSGSSYGYGSGTGSGYGSGAPSMPGGNVSGGTDWLRVVQAAAPVIATLSGNAKVGQFVGIIGSGAQVYSQVSSGQDLTTSNYANIANIALQAAAIGSKNPNVINAARLGNVGVGALNVYEAGQQRNGASTAGSSMTQIGQTPQGQAVYRDSSGATVAYAGRDASGQPVFQSATSSPASNSVTSSSGPTWGSASGDRTRVSPGQMAADANAMARANGIPDYSNGETASSVSSALDIGSGSSPKPGSISPAQMASDKAMLDRANVTLDRALAPGSSSWNSGQISPEGAAAANARGTPVDNSELQGSPSYAAYPQVANSNANAGSSSWNTGQISSDGALNAAARGTPVDNSELQGQSYVTDPRSVNDNTTPAETVRTTYTPAARPVARPVARPAVNESATAASPESVPTVASAAPSEWISNSPIPAGYNNSASAAEKPRYIGSRAQQSADKAAAKAVSDKVAADKKAVGLNDYLKNTPSVTDFMQ